MATFILLPDGWPDPAILEWLNNSGGTAAATDVDNDNGDTEYITDGGHGSEVTFTFANPSVVESDIDFTQTVTVQLKGSAEKTDTYNSTFYMNQTGGAISNGTDTITITGGGSGFQNFSGTAETTYDGSTTWTYALLHFLRVKLEKFRNDRFGELQLSYLYAEVTYTPTRYTNDVIGIDSGDIGKIWGIATADISKVNGV